MRLVSETLNESIEYFNDTIIYENLLLESLNEDFNVERIKSLIEKIKNKKTLLSNLVEKFNASYNLKLKKYIASVIAILFLSYFAYNKIDISKENINKISSQIAQKEKIKEEDLSRYMRTIDISQFKEIENPTVIEHAKISKEGKEAIKSHEQLRLKAYTINYRTKDKNGNTIIKNDGMINIGWGHAEPIKTSKLKIGDEITEKQAEVLFQKDILTAEKGVKRLFKDWKDKGIDVQINQNMYDAIVSMAFNMGISGLRKTEFIQKLKDKNYKEAGELIKKLSASKKYPGLKIRRESEHKLFTKKND
jgi:lysozyme